MRERWGTMKAAKLGSDKHELAQRCITLKQKLPNTKQTLNMYVNDAIGYRMEPELVLFGSKHCFGTADALSFRKNLLRIFDLKTGVNKASVDQLLVYAALFCIEYEQKPFDLEYDLRIYQNDEKMLFEVDPKDVVAIIDQIKTFSRYMDEWEEEAFA